MKHIFIPILYLCLCISASFAQTTVNPPSDKRDGKLPLKPSTGKRQPSNIWIDFTYSIGVIEFTSFDIYNSLVVTITNSETGESWNEVITVIQPRITFSTTPGSYYITCISDRNQIFAGFIEQ